MVSTSACAYEGWSGGVRQGNYERFLKVHFGDVYRVIRVELTQTSVDKLSSFRLDTSTDGILWQDGQVVRDGRVMEEW